MKAKLFLGSALAVLAASCASASGTPNCTVTVNLTPDEDGMYVYLLDYDNGEKLDSALVENNVAVFKTEVATPRVARLVIDGNRLGEFLLEEATISVDPFKKKVNSNGELNTRYEKLNETLGALVTEYRSLPDDSIGEVRGQEIFNRYKEILDSTLIANIDNAFGYWLFSSNVSEFDLAELDGMLEKYPNLKNYKRIQDARQQLLIKEETSVGHKYKDFAITNDGKTQRLSDYVGSDHYTLVDFWASWCGPCIRETKVIKQLYEKYNGKGLEVLGVAVWDEPENTLEAIESHALPWNQILNAQRIPTDLYGINGIPCIILIAPDGTIVSRDQQDEDLINDVEAAMNSFKQTEQE